MNHIATLALLLLAPCFAEAQVERLVLGTADNGWEELAELMGGMWVVDGGSPALRIGPSSQYRAGREEGQLAR